MRVGASDVRARAVHTKVYAQPDGLPQGMIESPAAGCVSHTDDWACGSSALRHACVLADTEGRAFPCLGFQPEIRIGPRRVLHARPVHSDARRWRARGRGESGIAGCLEFVKHRFQMREVARVRVAEPEAGFIVAQGKRGARVGG